VYLVKDLLLDRLGEVDAGDLGSEGRCQLLELNVVILGTSGVRHGVQWAEARRFSRNRKLRFPSEYANHFSDVAVQIFVDSQFLTCCVRAVVNQGHPR
jgi:hypothetical protein